jgi:hypothetical protein
MLREMADVCRPAHTRTTTARHLILVSVATHSGAVTVKQRTENEQFLA